MIYVFMYALKLIVGFNFLNIYMFSEKYVTLCVFIRVYKYLIWSKL